MSPLGSSGTEINSGYISEEYLWTLQGKEAADIWDKMRRSDGKIKMILSAVKNPIRSATWEVEAADIPDGEKHKEFIKHCLFHDQDKSWLDTVGEMLTMIEFGHSAFEEVHKVVLNHPEFGSYVGLKHLGFRSQKTIERWNVDKNDNLLSITQYAQGDLNRSVDIPCEFLVIFSMDKEGSNWPGISMLRPCYGPWIRKTSDQKMKSIGNEKFAVPTPILKYPANKFNTDEYANAIEALRKYTTHECNYLTLPEGWDVTFPKNDYDPAKLQSSIDGEDKQMVFAFLANFLELGMSGGGGSYSLGSDLSDFFLGGITHIADLITQQLNRGTVKRLIDLKFGPQAKYPELKATGIDDKAGLEFSQMMDALTKSKIITPDDLLEENIRARMSLPKKSDIGVRDVTPPGLPGMGAGFGAKPAAADPKADPAAKPEPKDVISEVVDPKAPIAELPAPEKKLSEVPPVVFALAEKVARAQIRDGKKEVVLIMQEHTGMMARDLVDQLISKAKAAPEKSRAQAYKAVSPKGAAAYREALKNAIAKVALEALEQARREVPAAKSIKLSEFDELPAAVKKRIQSQVDLIIGSQEADIEKALYFQFQSSVGSTDSLALVQKDLTLRVEQYIGASGIGTAAANLVSITVNETRNAFFFEPDVLEEIEAFMFVNADPQAGICKDLAGTTFRKDDPESARYFPPLHHNCESYIVPIPKGKLRGRVIDPTGLKPSSPELEDSITLGECRH